MSGFKHDPLADIAALQEMLNDRYDFSSIPKELVQNADDAGAEQLHFGWWPGWPDSGHALLRGPSLLVLNDGEFRPENYEGIRSLGLGSKGGDTRSIGKFGLGMKSIFHLCEAFIYVASKNQPAARGEALCNILNPWSSSGIHDEWDYLDPHREILIRTVAEWAHGASRWLCLWIPLRRKTCLDGKYPIVEQYPEVDAFLHPDLPRRLSLLFPFLGSLRTFDIWQFDRQSGLKKDISIALDPAASRRRYPNLAMGEASQVSGLVKIRHGRETHARDRDGALFRGRETFVRDEQLAALQRKEEFWPARPTYDRETARPRIVREKGLPHAGAAISILAAARANKGRLEVKRAVFLPLSSTLDEREVGGAYDFQLLLHGYFFLDAGRRDIHPDNSWNDLLEGRGTVPLVLPVLDDLKKHPAHLMTEDFRRLTKGLSEVPFLRRHADELCHEHQWMYQLRADTGCWNLLASDVPYLCIPAPPDRGGWSLQQLLPELRTITEKICVSFSQWPRFSLRGPSSWVESGYWAELLQAAPEQFLHGPDRLEYLNGVLRYERELRPEAWENKPALVSPLLSLGRDLFRGLNPQKVEEHAEDLKNFVAILPEKTWFALPEGDGELTIPEHSVIVDGLLNLDVSILLVPSNLVPKNVKSGAPTAEDVAVILSWLENSLDSQLERKATAVALEVVARAGTVDVNALRRLVGHMRIFRAHDLRESREVPASWNELSAWRSEGRLFGSGGVFVEPLQRALSTSRIYRLIGSDHRTSDVLFPGYEVRACDAAACVAVLLAKPVLARPEQRRRLLERLLDQRGSATNDEHVKALRYLLHARPDHAEDVSTPLLASSQEKERDVWGRLAELALRQTASAWRWSPGELSDALSPEHHRYLCVSVVGPDSVQRLLSEAENLDWLDAEVLTTQDRREVLSRLTDVQLWKRVPLHETLDGRFVAIAGPAYLASDKTIPQELATLVTAVRVPQDSLLRAIYLDRIPEWNPSTSISIALEQEHPHRLQSMISNAIGQIWEDGNDLDKELEGRLKEVPWLLARDIPVCPRDVLHLPRLEGDLSRLLAEAEVRGAFVDISSLDEALRQHAAEPWLKQHLYTHGGDALEVLGMILSEVPRYCLGLPQDVLTAGDGLQDLLKAFDDGGPPGFPAYTLLQNVAEEYPSQVSRLAKPLLRRISTQSILNILSYLSGRVEHAVGEGRQGFWAIHSLYLRALIESPEFSTEELRNVKLLSRRKRWKPAQQLTCDVAGVDDVDLLDETHREILSSVLKENIAGETNAVLAGAAEDVRVLRPDDLRKYFRPWNDRVPSEVIGGFVALLGDEPSMLRVAEEFLHGRRTVRNVRDVVSWEIGPAEAAAVGAHEDIHEAMAKQRFKLSVLQSGKGATVSTLNIVKEPFEARIREVPEHLVVGALESRRDEGFRSCLVKLRQIDPEGFTKDQLCTLLRESAALILKAVYRRSPENLEAVWEKLSESEQLDLEVAQRLILESAFFYFRQLRDETLSSSLHEFGKRWDEMRYREAEERYSGSSEHLPSGSDLRAEKENIRSELQRAFENNAAIQADTLAAVRRKVCEYQYLETSVPFELFQNADDAASELAEMVGEKNLPVTSRRFVTESTDDSLVLLHWGRAINRFRGGDFSAQAGIARGFKRDLEKMLVLSSSDKGTNSSNATGKFGLGFKSVFLISDAPKVVSGRLGFDVAGGMFPRRLPQEDQERLTRLLENYAVDAAEGTAVELPLNAGAVGPTGKALNWFRELGHLLPVFSRVIKECLLKEPRGELQAAAWQGETVGHISEIATDKLKPFAGSTHRGSGGLLIRCGTEGAVLFGLDSRGVCHLPPSTPTFWVTAPTRDLLGRGIAVNGSFELDVGRAQLARASEANQRLACTLGERLGELLEALHRESSEWRRLQSDMDLAPDATPEEFWRSLWNVTSQALPDQQGSSTELLRAILWENGRGMARLLWRADVLPTDLPGEFSCLTRLEVVQYFTSGIINDEELFRKVGDWTGFARTVVAGTIIAQSVQERLRRLLEKVPDWRLVRLIDALAWEIPRTKDIDLLLGVRLGEVVNPELLIRLENDHQTKDEGMQVAEFLAGCRFKSQAGRYLEARDLVVASQRVDERDESLRAAFAPPDRVLHSDYEPLALSFFRACRGKLRAPAEALVDWGCEANEPEKREAFLRYLLEGDLSSHVARLAALKRSETWLDSLPHSRLLKKFSPPDQIIILALLGFDLQLPPQPESTPPLPMDQVEIFLRRVEKWWSNDRISEAQVDRYLQNQYPPGCRLDLSERDRFSWMILLIRAAGYTIGRTQDWQTRGFIEHCDQRGWLYTFAMEPPPQSSTSEWNRCWIGVLDDFANQGRQYVEYLHWVRLLPIIYRVSTHLDQYVEIFLGLDRGAEANVDPYKILTPALDEELEGGALAPSLLQSVGLGIFFILRELVRTEAIQGDRVRPHCFVPSLRIRRGFKNLGCTALDLGASGKDRLEWSEQIVRFLEERGVKDSTFHRSFDIPFIVLSNPDWLDDADNNGRELAEFWKQSDF